VLAQARHASSSGAGRQDFLQNAARAIKIPLRPPTPTDPAVVFSVLGGRKVGSRAGAILEGAAGVNDPAGIAPMIGMIELATHADASFLVVVREFAVLGDVPGAEGIYGVVFVAVLFSVLAQGTLVPTVARTLRGDG
jgi:NhaP-type Na+/H+ and K+/H+ antiporter